MSTTDWSGKVVLITGATNGIGLEAALDLAARGQKGSRPTVVVVGRSADKLARCVEQIRAAADNADVHGLLCNFESQRAVRQLAADFRARWSRLDLLVNNAGTVYDTRALTEDGIERTFAVNHLGYFLLTTLLLDLVEASAPARIVNVSSRGHQRGTLDFDDLGFEKGYGIMDAYCRSKLCNVLFTLSLKQRLVGKNITVASLHPGAVATGIWDHAPAWTQPLLWIPRKLFFISPKQGGEAILNAATGDFPDGTYFNRLTPEPPSALGRDAALAERLWTVSEGLVARSA